jgi:hypothetical protein
MKKTLALLALILFASLSCKKEPALEGLSAFVIGDWKSQEVRLWTQAEGVPYADGEYSISIKTDGTYRLIFPGVDDAGLYIITGNKISFDKFQIDPIWGDPPGPLSFFIDWIPGEIRMEWEPVGVELVNLIMIKQ